MSRWIAFVLAYVVLPVFCHPAFDVVVVAQEPGVRKAVETAEFAQVVKQVQDFSKKHGAQNVLLVVDVDNTLLAMNQDLGSDQWYGWQEGLLKSDPSSPHLVGATFDELLNAQGVLFSLSSMHPPEPNLPALFNGLLERKKDKEGNELPGITTVVLTSRGKDFRNATESELERNGYDIAGSALQINEKRGVFLPYGIEKEHRQGLDVETIFDLGKPRPVTYSDGIYLTAGQHKGYMLRTLLARSKAKFAAIVFVDDHEKHTQRMHEAFEESPIDLATFRYSREDGNVARFNTSSKEHVVRDWNLLEQFRDAVIVK
ncbi:DUF2608 domain-containing protein [Rhodopirellula sp. MGV]|uniref:DUF2608 domain-containing protein n=1 Tax=Rhodopirellula sp. MGV TaxID=2023130 RepID=UPI000B97612D|nr:DUF2608 domain-containing protein [Rhodopirellula sp. MGV]OYP37543.1 hypothetical protein CGZ80_05325 [Rhodopirellula sp. MGV]PNY37948.1 DUF2608 domain-containing protein [Rhodopirellula baltica]